MLILALMMLSCTALAKDSDWKFICNTYDADREVIFDRKDMRTCIPTRISDTDPIDMAHRMISSYIGDMVDKIEEGYDMVIGSRFVEKPKPRSLRMLGSRVISTAIKITTGVHIADPTSGMRLFNKTLIREFAENINYEPEPDTVSFLIKQGVKVAEVQVEMKEREAGESYLNLSRSIVYMTKMFVSIIILQNFRNRKK